MQKGVIPQAAISNKLIHARLYLPDIENGYYRGTRFDWSGVIASLEYSGHNYFGQWFENYSPTLHDAIMGPVDDFTPVGYNEAKPGDTFLKIGIGMIVKPDDKPYTFSRTYPTDDLGKWDVRIEPHQALYIHILDDRDYHYTYEKTVRLVGDKPSMVLTHAFKNRGKNTIETLVYNHNFFVINNQPVGPGFTAEFPFDLSGVFIDGPDIAELRQNRIVLNRNIGKGETIFCENLTGFGQDKKDYDIKIENHTTGAGARIACDRPLAKMVFWSCPTTFCPEPYILIKAEPGRKFTWNINYDFYNCR
jgi:hypothetical protein